MTEVARKIRNTTRKMPQESVAIPMIPAKISEPLMAAAFSLFLAPKMTILRSERQGAERTTAQTAAALSESIRWLASDSDRASEGSALKSWRSNSARLIRWRSARVRIARTLSAVAGFGGWWVPLAGGPE
jgi:hypothetical protein